MLMTQKIMSHVKILPRQQSLSFHRLKYVTCSICVKKSNEINRISKYNINEFDKRKINL